MVSRPPYAPPLQNGPASQDPPPEWIEILQGALDGILPTERSLEEMFDRIEDRS
ncbi:MAG: hypothetical protein AAGB10_03835 [Pseudomonadota bacterium]